MYIGTFLSNELKIYWVVVFDIWVIPFPWCPYTRNESTWFCKFYVGGNSFTLMCPSGFVGPLSAFSTTLHPPRGLLPSAGQLWFFPKLSRCFSPVPRFQASDIINHHERTLTRCCLGWDDFLIVVVAPWPPQKEDATKSTKRSVLSYYTIVTLHPKATTMK